MGPSAALRLPRPAPPPSESGEGHARPGRCPAPGPVRLGRVVCERARARARCPPASPVAVCVPRGLGRPCAPRPPLRRASGGCLPPAPVPGSPLAGGARARVGAAWLREALPWGVAPGWTERMEVGDGLPRRGSRGSGPQRRALWGGPGSWGGSLRVLRPAGAAGVAGPPSCWWRWDPVHVYPVARLASPLARPSPSPCLPPRARALSGPRFVRVPPPRSLRPTSRSVLPFFSPRLGLDDRARVRPFSSPSPVTVSGPRPGLAVCRVPAPPLGRHGSWGAGSRAECCRPHSRE